MKFTQHPLNPDSYIMKLIKDEGNVPSKTNPNRSYRHAIFECPICLTHFSARATGAKAKTQTSCGNCSRKTHEASKEPLYAIWNGIKQRCYSPARKDYHKYGGKGVTMCEEWKDDPREFITWCKNNGWKPELVIDKDIKSKQLGINPPIYSPETISFITTQENAKAANGKQVEQLSIIDGTVINIFDTTVEAALALGKPKAAKSSIANCCRGITHTAFGFKWRYSQQGPLESQDSLQTIHMLEPLEGVDTEV